MQGRVRRSVGLNEAVDAEVVIRWSVRPSEITAICPYILAVDLGGDALVNPIPDVTTLQDVVLVDHIPILLEASDAVPHRMSVLAHDERQSTRRALIELAILRQLCLARVHRAIDVGVRIDALDIVGLPSGIPAGVFVLHEPRGIPMLDPHVRGVHVDAVASLVRQRPEQDAGMVLVPLHMALHASQVGVTPLVFAGQGLVQLKAHPMTLDVRLGNQVQAVFVTELVPHWVVRVMGTTHRVEVVSLHELDVLQHCLTPYDMSRLRIVLMSIHASDGQLLAVEQHPTLPQLDGPEADGHADDLSHSAVDGRPFRGQGHDQSVQVRFLGAPKPHSRALERCTCDGDFVSSGRHKGLKSASPLSDDALLPSWKELADQGPQDWLTKVSQR
mmetsp:Transcript_13555/g.37268  ORF Transcript_13555/g.37268 Transcript_13555/m.37268 type:complete len:387 (+) Transcript_13555:2214-3374(+)